MWISAKIKKTISSGVGEFVTCSIGFGANRHLAKIACKMDKPDGVTIWHPHMMPGPLLDLPFDDIPGIGGRMEQRLMRAGIHIMPDDAQRTLIFQAVQHRHDCVHRNGSDKEGVRLTAFTDDYVNDTIDLLTHMIEHIESEITKVFYPDGLPF